MCAIEELCTPDVKVWAPAMFASSVADLAEKLEDRDNAFSDLALDLAPLEVGGDYACVEWCVTMTHSGGFVMPDGFVIQPTGFRVTVNGATVAEFEGDRICSLRQYWDEFGVLEQLGVLADKPS
jgi:hypothetical protein